MFREFLYVNFSDNYNMNHDSFLVKGVYIYKTILNSFYFEDDDINCENFAENNGINEMKIVFIDQNGNYSTKSCYLDTNEYNKTLNFLNSAKLTKDNKVYVKFAYDSPIFWYEKD